MRNKINVQRSVRVITVGCCQPGDIVEVGTGLDVCVVAKRPSGEVFAVPLDGTRCTMGPLIRCTVLPPGTKLTIMICELEAR